MKEKTPKSFLFFGRIGCLLPFLIIFNLFFGWLFLNPLLWLLIETVLILAFLANAFIFLKRITSISSNQSNGNIIDVEAKVLGRDDNPPEKRL